MIETSQSFAQTKLKVKNRQFRFLGYFLLILLPLIYLFSNVNPLRITYLPKLMDPARVDLFLICSIFVVLGMIFILFGLVDLRKTKMMYQTSTSRIGSIMRSGFFEIQGMASATKLFEAPLSKKSCVWYKLVLEGHKNRGVIRKWSTMYEFTPADYNLTVDDGSGIVNVDESCLNALNLKSQDITDFITIESNEKVIEPLLKNHPDTSKSVSKLFYMSLGRNYAAYSYFLKEYRIENAQELYALGFIEKTNTGASLSKKLGYPVAFALGDEEKLSGALKSSYIGYIMLGLSIALIAFTSGYFVSKPSNFASSSVPIVGPNTNSTFTEMPEVEENPNYTCLASSTSPTYFRIQKPINLNGYSKEKIIALRKDAVARSISHFDYQPLPAVYDQILDGKPWWGWYGILFFGPGERANQGPSFRSNSILNPMALVWPNFWEQNLRGNYFWNNSVPKDEASALDFQIQPDIQKIEFNPETKILEAHYNLSSYSDYISRYTKVKINSGVFINFEAINARDMGYPFVLLDLSKSSNIKKLNKSSNISIKSAEFYHLGHSCGIAGGCNNLSPFQEGLSNYVVGPTPAVAEFKLWHKKPAHFSDAADVTYKIYFD